jgi:hypothetical protein
VNPVIQRRLEKRSKDRWRRGDDLQSKEEACFICGKWFNSRDCPHSWGDIKRYVEAFRIMEIINE